MAPARPLLAALTVFASAALAALVGVAVVGLAWGAAVLVAYGWRLAAQWPREAEMTRSHKAVEAVFATAIIVWLASDVWRATTFAGVGEQVAPGPEILGHVGTALLILSIVGVVRSRGPARLETWLDALSFVAAISAPAYLAFIRPAMQNAELFPWVATWVGVTLVLLFFGGVYIMSGGLWNVPAVLVGVAVSGVVATAVLLHLLDPTAVVGVPRYVPAYVLGVFVALHPGIAEMHLRGGRRSGLPLSTRVWLLVGALFLPLGALGWCYVQAVSVPVLAVVGPFGLMAAIVGIRAALLMRAGIRDWSVPLTISLAALSVSSVAVAITMQSESARDAQRSAAELAARLPEVKQLDGLFLRAAGYVGGGPVEAQRSWVRVVRNLKRSAGVPRVALDRYVERATPALDASRQRSEMPQGGSLASVDAAHDQLVDALTAATSRAQERAARQAHSVRLFSVAALMMALLVLATLLLRFNRARSRLQLQYEKTHDGLTDLPNRVALERELRGSPRADAAGARRTLVLLDLDDFKAVNDAFGLATGDMVIATIAARLDAVVRGDNLVVRMDGDAFAILVPAEQDPFAVAHRALAAVATPIDLDDHEHTIYASAGLVEVNESDKLRHSSAVRDAELAMYEAKRTVGNSVQLFAPDMHERVRTRIQLAIELRDAINHDGLHLVYQPIVDLANGRTTGYEALVRWDHPERGFMSPGDFIPLAEESGLIVELGGWVLRTATEQLAVWQKLWRDDRYVSVNVAAAQLQTGVLEEQVRAALQHSGLPAKRLLLEVTESSLIDAVDRSVDQMRRIRDLGVRFALDDFGTGYSSLSYLRRFPVDVLKVDKSFIDGLHEPDGALLVRAIIDMATSLRLSVVAEGIEAEDQAARLRQFGCELAQGFHFSRPLPAAAVPDHRLRVDVAAGPTLRALG